MYFIDDDIIKGIGGKSRIYVGLGKSLDRAEKVRSIPVFLTAGQKARIFPGTPDVFITLAGRFGNEFPVDDE